MRSLCIQNLQLGPAPFLLSTQKLIALVTFLFTTYKKVNQAIRIQFKYHLHITLFERGPKIKNSWQFAAQIGAQDQCKAWSAASVLVRERKDASTWELLSISPLREGLALSLFLLFPLGRGDVVT